MRTDITDNLLWTHLRDMWLALFGLALPSAIALPFLLCAPDMDGDDHDDITPDATMLRL
jgi:hypothetical protein